MRARVPDREGYVEHRGVKLGFEVFGDGSPTIVLLPTWRIVHSRLWKAQVPYLARHFRVVTFDGPGNGRSDRPLDSAPYENEWMISAIAEVLDATDTERAVLVSISKAPEWSLRFSAEHPDRVLGQVFIAPSLRLTDDTRPVDHAEDTFDDEIADPQGWEKFNAHHWRTDYTDFAEFFFAQVLPEPHSTRQREQGVEWALETTAEVLILSESWVPDRDTMLGWCDRITTPVLVIHGSEDPLVPRSWSETLADATGGQLVVLDGVGHNPPAREPAKVNLLLTDFVHRTTGWQPPPRTAWPRAQRRSKRVLYISSPIGLGHIRRDLATVTALRAHHPDVHVDWLAQHPVTRVLEAAGETIHPASRHLASESAHFESEAGEHDLHAFQTWRRMDEILIADFMVFHDAVTATDYDLVVGDEAWNVDYFLHENPELKRFAYVWATDFVGWLPMPDGGPDEAWLTADYNAEMIEQIARYPRIRDAALFVGNPDDIIDAPLGPDLPMIRDWTQDHYTFTGYTGIDPSLVGDRDELRAQLGYRPDEQVCIVTVGGTGVGEPLLRRVIDAYPLARRRVPGLRMIVVAGPRIEPDALPHHDGLEVRGYVHDLPRHLAVSDLAIVQGGLSTCMELTATGTPFIYIPLQRHFEQHFHVHHRLAHHRAGRRIDYPDATPDHLADAIAADIGRTVDYRPVDTHGAANAATIIAELL
jgi:pimeloyl-ACP methyl ester carboxylesterase/predicted glycosyltransferase